jgi:hypothetical protein
MRPLDSRGLTSPEGQNAMHLRLVITRAAGDEADQDQEASQSELVGTPIVQDEADPDVETTSHTELAKLRNSIHQLRAENLALRTRIERLKSNRSLERTLIIGGMVSLWFFFLLSVITKLIAASN